MLYPHFRRLDLDVPWMFFSGQILSKFAKSSDGRALSIGTQYLKIKPCEVTITTRSTERNKPYRVQPVHQFHLLRPTTDKVLHDLQLLFVPSLESSGVVENITVMICEGQFVIDVMLPALYKQDR